MTTAVAAQTGGGAGRKHDRQQQQRSRGDGAQQRDRRGEWSTVRVANVPLDTHRVKLEELFSDFGAIKKCYVLKGKDGSESTLGYVTFSKPEDANEVAKLTDLKYEDNLLDLKIAPNAKLKDRGKNPNKGGGDENPAAGKRGDNNRKPRGNPRKARLIVRNLSFNATDDKTRKLFEKYGSLEEINILKKENGRLVGCAFIQYKNPNHAAKAIKELNAKHFLGRPIAVDWAVPKEVFKGASEVKEEIKEEPVEIKEEPHDESAEVKLEESEIKEEIKDEVKEEVDSEDEGGDVKDGNADDTDDESEDDEEDSDDEEEEPSRKPHNLSTGHDVEEKKTVFIKNLSFQSDEEDLRDMMEEIFGPVYYAKMVMDKQMEHPKGTAFVKFKNAEDAAKCIEVSQGKEGLFLDKRQIYGVLAIKQDDVKSAVEERKKKEAKDSRNLYLAREGMIREGTKAAEGVSSQDLDKRRQLEKHKKIMLKNLNMFVSKTRLCIRNIPPTLDDGKLRKLVLKYSPTNSKLQECKVMKDLKKFENGKPVSKQFGFVTFARHDDALSALRNLNNNPEVFSSEKRPIVDFAIENRKAIQARQKREEKSKLKNPNYKGKTGVGGEGEKGPQSGGKKTAGADGETSKSDFTGTISDPKIKTLPKHTGPKIRHNKPKITRKELRKQEQDRKNPKKRKIRQREIASETSGGGTSNQDQQQPTPAKKQKKNPTKQSKSERKDEKENKAFESLVSQYKKKFDSNQQVLKKWFDS